MKRPPPDQAARLFTVDERTQAARLAREDVLRQPTPSALERAVDDVKEGTAIGASIIAHAATSSVSRARARVGVVFRAVAHAASLVATALLSGVAVAWRATVWTMTAGWRALVRVGTGAVLALLALGLAVAAVLVGLAGVTKTGVLLLARALGIGSRRLWHATGLASRAGAAASTRAGVAGGQLLARSGVASSRAAVRASGWSRAFLLRTAHDLSRLRLTIRWHARAARPIVEGVAGGFTQHLAQTIRHHTQPKQLIASLSLTAAALIVVVYGAPRGDRPAVKSPTARPVAASSQPALASVAPATNPADTAKLIESLTERSAALLGNASRSREKPATTPAPAAVRARGAAAPRSEPPQAGSMMGTLTIASAPKGANVTIDGIPRGVAPLSVSRLRAGNRIVRLELTGYQRWSWAVYVSPSRQTRLNVSLVPDSSPTPSTALTDTAAAAK